MNDILNGLKATNTHGGTRLGPAIYWTDSSIAANAHATHTITFQVAAHAHGKILIAVAAASIHVKDPNYANNAAAIIVALGPTGTQSTTPAPRNPLALGERIISRLEGPTLQLLQKHQPVVASKSKRAA